MDFYVFFDSLINRDLVFFDYFFVRKLDMKNNPQQSYAYCAPSIIFFLPCLSLRPPLKQH